MSAHMSAQVSTHKSTCTYLALCMIERSMLMRFQSLLRCTPPLPATTLCLGMRVDMRSDMHVDMWVDMCIDMCV